MTKAEIITSLANKKMQENDGTDILAYTTGLNDMYDAIHQVDESNELTKRDYEWHDLQIGDWFKGTKEQYCKVLKLENSDYEDDQIERWAENMVAHEVCCFTGNKDLFWYFRSVPDDKKTELTSHEFLRRAKNSFKKVQKKEI